MLWITNKQYRLSKFSKNIVIESLQEIDELLTYIKESKIYSLQFQFKYNWEDYMTANIDFTKNLFSIWIDTYKLALISNISQNKEIIKTVLKEKWILKRVKRLNNEKITSMKTVEKELFTQDLVDSDFDKLSNKDLNKEIFQKIIVWYSSGIESYFSDKEISLNLTFRRNNCVGYYRWEGKSLVRQINDILAKIYNDYDTILWKTYQKWKYLTLEQMERYDERTEENEGSSYSEYEQTIWVNINF